MDAFRGRSCLLTNALQLPTNHEKQLPQNTVNQIGTPTKLSSNVHYPSYVQGNAKAVNS
jgi:hypothetical protein